MEGNVNRKRNQKIKHKKGQVKYNRTIHMKEITYSVLLVSWVISHAQLTKFWLMYETTFSSHKIWLKIDKKGKLNSGYGHQSEGKNINKDKKENEMDCPVSTLSSSHYYHCDCHCYHHCHCHSTPLSLLLSLSPSLPPSLLPSLPLPRARAPAPNPNVQYNDVNGRLLALCNVLRCKWLRIYANECWLNKMNVFLR